MKMRRRRPKKEEEKKKRKEKIDVARGYHIQRQNVGNKEKTTPLHPTTTYQRHTHARTHPCMLAWLSPSTASPLLSFPLQNPDTKSVLAKAGKKQGKVISHHPRTPRIVFKITPNPRFASCPCPPPARSRPVCAAHQPASCPKRTASPQSSPASVLWP